MPMRFTSGSLPGLVFLEPEVFEDSRGFFLEIYHSAKYRDAGIDCIFIQDNHSHSRRGCLRGLHYQLRHPQGKLVYAAAGDIFDVAVDIRRGSPTFGKWEGIYLSSANGRQVFIPEGFAHGFCVLSETADVIYKCSDFYAPEDEYGILWSDPAIGINWPILEPLLSKKDSGYPRLQDIPAVSLPD